MKKNNAPESFEKWATELDASIKKEIEEGNSGLAKEWNACGVCFNSSTDILRCTTCKHVICLDCNAQMHLIEAGDKCPTCKSIDTLNVIDWDSVDFGELDFEPVITSEEVNNFMLEKAIKESENEEKLRTRREVFKKMMKLKRKMKFLKSEMKKLKKQIN